MADKLLPLHDLQNVNTVLGMLYDANGVYRADFEPGVFYNTILLDTLKYGEENYVHLKNAENLSIRKGDTVARFRRWAGLTPTLRPLKEGVPPAPDKHAYETIEVGNVFSFGRWSEYTDRIDLSIISEVIAERSLQYGELANQTKELYARKTWLASPNEFFAGFKSFSELAFGDTITLDDLRFLTARMKRMLVKPISGKFNYICSTEFINGLIDDPRVKQYMEIEQTTGKMWGSGEAFPMFDLNFIPTMLDEFAYPDTEFPGVYELSTGLEVIRLYAVSSDGANIYYMDVHQDYAPISGGDAAKVLSGLDYLPDGTAIDNHYKWEFPLTADTLTSSNAADGSTTEATASKVALSVATRTYVPSTGLWSYGAPSSGIVTAPLAAINTLIDAGAFQELPVHRGILFGMEAMVKLNQDGISDMPKIIVKALGSSGVADALDQRQSLGFKVDGFGLAIKRPEAICITYGIPKYAEMASLTDQFITGDYTLMDDLQEYAYTAYATATGYTAGDYVLYEGDVYIVDTTIASGDNAAWSDVLAVSTLVAANYIDVATGEGVLRVDGVNSDTIVPLSPFINGAGIYPIFSSDATYSTGDTVLYDGKPYVMTTASDVTGAWVLSEWTEVKVSLETNLLENDGNDPTSNIR